MTDEEAHKRHCPMDRQRVLQQAVTIDKAPGHMWVDVPEVEDVR